MYDEYEAWRCLLHAGLFAAMFSVSEEFEMTNDYITLYAKGETISKKQFAYFLTPFLTLFW